MQIKHLFSHKFAVFKSDYTKHTNNSKTKIESKIMQKSVSIEITNTFDRKKKHP